MQRIQNTVIGALETVKNKLEEADSSVAERQKVFATGDAPAAPEGASSLDNVPQVDSIV
jgi:hypothetical protein